MLVATVARALGVHLLEINAYQLLGNTEQDTVRVGWLFTCRRNLLICMSYLHCCVFQQAKIADMLEAAKSFTPCMIHIRRFHALKVLHSLINTSSIVHLPTYAE